MAFVSQALEHRASSRDDLQLALRRRRGRLELGDLYTGLHQPILYQARKRRGLQPRSGYLLGHLGSICSTAGKGICYLVANSHDLRRETLGLILLTDMTFSTKHNRGRPSPC